MPIDLDGALERYHQTALSRIATLEGELRDYERSMEKANLEILDLKDKLAAVERENRQKCTELAEKAFEIRELRGVVDAAAVFRRGIDQGGGDYDTDLDELRKRLDALDLPDERLAQITKEEAEAQPWQEITEGGAKFAALRDQLEVIEHQSSDGIRLTLRDGRTAFATWGYLAACGGREGLFARLLRIPNPHTGAPGNSVDTRVERDPEP